MAISTTRKLLFVIQKRCLKTSATVPPSSLPPLTKDSNFSIHFLANSCGLPLQSAISISQKFHLEQKKQKNLLSVVNFFKDEGFNQTQIAKLIEKKPELLHCRVDTNLKPKLEFLKENGFAGELLLDLLISNFRRGISSYMKTSLEFFKSYVDSDKKIVRAIWRSYCWSYSKDGMQSNVDFLLKEGMSNSTLSYLIATHPSTLMQNRKRLLYAVSVVKKLGIEPCKTMFVHALKAVMCMSESTLKKKMALLRRFGCREGEILMAFKKEPLVMSCSEEKLRKSMDFYVNTVKLDLRAIMKCPKLLMFAIDSRICPRYDVLKILKSKKLIDVDIKGVSLFTISEKTFLHKYVTKYKDIIPGLSEMYSTRTKARRLALDG